MVTAAASVLLPLLVIFYFSPEFSRLLLEMTEQRADQFARHMASDMNVRDWNLDQVEFSAAIEREVTQTRRDLGVEKVRVFKPNGEIVISTDRSEIGTVNRKDYFHQIVAKGRLFSKIVRKETSTLDGLESPLDLAEVYVPIMKDGRFTGAFELYYDLTADKRRLDALVVKFGWMIVLLAAGLEGVIALLLVSAGRMVERQGMAQKQLKQEKEFSETVFNAIGEPIAVIDPVTLEVLVTNQAFLDQMHLPKERVIGKLCYQLIYNLNSPCTSKDHVCPLEATIASGQLSTARHIHYRGDGEAVYVDISTHPIKNEQGMVEKVIHTSRENHEFKIADEEKKRLEERLARSEKMEALGLLAGGVAHDLNNVLSGIVSYPDLMLLDLPPESPLRGPIQTIQDSGKKAAAIVQDLLTLARRGAMAMETVNLNDIVEDYLRSPEHLKLQSFHKSVKTTTRLAPDLLNINGSEIHLKKTLMNLVSNAAEAQQDGGNIHISTHNRHLSAPLTGYEEVREGGYAVLKVKDKGTGIAAEDLERIFDPFYTKKKMGRSGTGLGMSVVWGTVKDHKGYVHVDSTLGQGTVFTLHFPVTNQLATAINKETPLDQYMGRGETIMVVDDVPEQRRIASEMLKRLGYHVFSADSGEAAIHHLASTSADLVLLDMIMDPGIDGLETYARMRSLRPGQKAIIASGYSETARVKKALASGVGQYLKKPYALESLGTAVRLELDKKS